MVRLSLRTRVAACFVIVLSNGMISRLCMSSIDAMALSASVVYPLSAMSNVISSNVIDEVRACDSPLCILCRNFFDISKNSCSL